MPRFHLLTPSIVPGDAVSTDVLAMRRWLRKQGHVAHAYAARCHEDLRGQVIPVKAYARFAGEIDDVLIYHHSVGWPVGIKLYESSRNRKVVRYHNVTPPSFHAPFNQDLVKSCRRGQVETGRLAQSKPVLFVPASEFNAAELVRLGATASRCRSVPPLHAISRLDNLPQNQTLARELQQHTNILFVGRLSPNKGHVHLIRALAYYRHHLGGTGRLILVGGSDPSLRLYTDYLHCEARRLRVEGHVEFRGKVGDSELRTYYAHASYFLCASEHEGFCVPLVEAMYYGVPVVAFGGGAVASTLGGAGICWPTPSAALLAESVRHLELNPQAREHVLSEQRARFDSEFTLPGIRQRLESALNEFGLFDVVISGSPTRLPTGGMPATQ